MTVKKSKNGNFIGCNGYPECKRAYPLPKGAMIQMTDSVCPVCGLAQIKVIRRGMPPSLQCIDPKCASNTEKNNLGLCPTCKKGTIRITYSRAGKRFAGCSEWPNCTQTYPLRPRGTITPTGEACPECGAPIIQMGNVKECINMDCPTRRKKRASAKDKDETEAADGKVGKVITVVLPDKKKRTRKASSAKTSAAAKKTQTRRSKKSESPALEDTGEE